jgi:hypothetical protein
VEVIGLETKGEIEEIVTSDSLVYGRVERGSGSNKARQQHTNN